MPNFTIAASKSETKCDTIWAVRIKGELIYLATDGTNPNLVDSGDWRDYVLDVDQALRTGVVLDMHHNNLGFPFRFPRPEGAANPSTGMTGRMLRCLENVVRRDRGDESLTFPLSLAGTLYVPITQAAELQQA